MGMKRLAAYYYLRLLIGYTSVLTLSLLFDTWGAVLFYLFVSLQFLKECFDDAMFKERWISYLCMVLGGALAYIYYVFCIMHVLYV